MRAFHALYLINQAYIVLLRKEDASEIGDYRPISLIHSCAKLSTKVLATRLAPLMHQLVRLNQSAFIQGRMIHENYRAVQLSAKLLRQSKKPSALLKIDIAKAFDTVSWSFLFLLLEHLGFSRRCPCCYLRPVQESFLMVRRAVEFAMLGGSGKVIHCRRCCLSLLWRL